MIFPLAVKKPTGGTKNYARVQGLITNYVESALQLVNEYNLNVRPSGDPGPSQVTILTDRDKRKKTKTKSNIAAKINAVVTKKKRTILTTRDKK